MVYPLFFLGFEDKREGLLQHVLCIAPAIEASFDQLAQNGAILAESRGHGAAPPLLPSIVLIIPVRQSRPRANTKGNRTSRSIWRLAGRHPSP